MTGFVRHILQKLADMMDESQSSCRRNMMSFVARSLDNTHYDGSKGSVICEVRDDTVIYETIVELFLGCWSYALVVFFRLRLVK